MFSFNGVNYLQKKGFAMNTKCVPSCVNLFMGSFEEHFIYPLNFFLEPFNLERNKGRV